MKVLLTILGILLIVMGLLLLLASPIAGIVAVIIGVFSLWYSRKKNKTVETKVQSDQKGDSEQPEIAENGFKRETIKVAGISQYTDAVLTLGTENHDYSLSKREIIENGLEDKEIPQYLFRTLPATFEFEPDNPYDSNAIAVYVTGVHIGYVKQGSTAHIRKLIEGNKIESASCEIVGGKLKRLDSEDGTIQKKDLNYGARITLKVKE